MRDAHRERIRLRQKIHSAIREERQQLNRNLHDHIGAQLVDLKLLADEIEERLTAEPELARKLTAQVDRTNQMLRSQMLWNEDLDLLSEDFFEGLNLILLRRYSSAGRRLRFEAACDSALLDFEDHPQATGESVRAALYAVTEEIGTNDLKYGVGTAHWVFSESRAPDDESAAPARELIARFEAETGYRLETHGLGRGTENIARRMAEIGGSVDLSLQERSVRIVLRVPLS
jgi:two-component system sensor histidine kinase ChiS